MSKKKTKPSNTIVVDEIVTEETVVAESENEMAYHVVAESEAPAEYVTSNVVEPQLTIGDNIFSDQPDNGTIVAQLSPEDLEAVMTISTELEAARHAQKDTGYQFLKNLIARNRTLWLDLAKRYNFPYRWDVALDYETGYIFISK